MISRREVKCQCLIYREFTDHLEKSLCAWRVPVENSNSPYKSFSYKQLFLYCLAGIEIYCEAKKT